MNTCIATLKTTGVLLHGLEISERNIFFPGRIEETGKWVFLPVTPEKNWKLEATAIFSHLIL